MKRRRIIQIVFIISLAVLAVLLGLIQKRVLTQYNTLKDLSE